MAQAVFLVTSFSGLRKRMFRNKIVNLVSDDIDVIILLAMVKFDEFELARRNIESTFRYHERKNRIHIQSLASLVETSTGVPLNTDEMFNQDFLAFEKKTFHNFEFDGTVDRYVKDGEIFGEVTMNDAGIPLKMSQFYHNEIMRSIVFEKGRLIGIMDYEQGNLVQGLLLNQHGKLVYRFIRYMRTVNWIYNLGANSKMNFPDQISKESSPNNRNDYQVSENQPYYKVIDHVSYRRLNDLYEFYAMVLESFNHADCHIFVDIDDNQYLMTHMSQQLIFNY